MEPTERRIIMTTPAITTNYVEKTLSDEEYSFKNGTSLKLNAPIFLKSYGAINAPYEYWRNADGFVSEIFDKEIKDAKDVFCFICSPYWQKDSKIVRHYALSKFLTKEYQCSELSYEVEDFVENDGQILFYGLVKVTFDNFLELLNISSKLETGFMFSLETRNKENLETIVRNYALKINIHSKTNTTKFPFKAIFESALHNFDKVFYVHSWAEVGENRADVFIG